ncbi:MAG: hypothetical protein KME64_28085 [Scytonematopsis contorta HA4267-MV1]|nr:hypothetical protein [Scytonematopsis contorta HA4267-MV1]
MTDDYKFDDIFERLNELTLDVTNLKIQTSTIGTTQLTISQLLTLTTGLTSDMRQVKADIRELKGNARNQDASIEEILRLLRLRNSGDN